MDSIFSSNRFSSRHLGSSPDQIHSMLASLKLSTMEELIEKTIPPSIRLKKPLETPPAMREEDALAALSSLADENQVFTSFIGMGYSDCLLPAVIRRNILENPGWYTAYTPYQAEISQGRMEALLNFQTMVAEMTGMDISNASLLDEATAAAEAMAMCFPNLPAKNCFLVDKSVHPQTRAVLQTRAEPLGIELADFDPDSQNAFPQNAFGILLQYPDTTGKIRDLSPILAQAKNAKILSVVACDLLSLALLKPPGECGADIAVGSAQRFGVPLGYGGPHPAFLAIKDEFKRKMPGRLIGVSRDSEGNPALRLTLQTREQHIRREKATSNICTAQVLLAVMASMFAVYHGPGGIRKIASSIHAKTRILASALRKCGKTVQAAPFFDTLCIDLGDTPACDLQKIAEASRLNLRILNGHSITVSLDETTTCIEPLLKIFSGKQPASFDPSTLAPSPEDEWPAAIQRQSPFLTHPVFNSYHTETEMLRYIRRLESKDLSLTTSMIPLGSCTMKLNATSEMLPVSWEKLSRLHPFAPAEQTEGYRKIFAQLETWLAEITGFAAASIQPNAGSQGEYAGLLLIRRYHQSMGQTDRTICLIPASAHGTNPASAAMAGFQVVPVKCDSLGNIDLPDLREKIATHQNRLGALMVTYPSTHGVFEESIGDICAWVHAAGGQVYLDGANMNAMVGLCRPGDFGADVCHLNLHKTFAIPHGGGGPGIGPVCAAKHLAPFLPGHPVVPTGGKQAGGPVSAAPWGSASVSVISWMYIAMMGPDGLHAASSLAILNANYIASRLSPFFDILYKGQNGFVAHECIIDLREWKARAGIEVDDVAKRLMDYGFHAPTMSWPVAGTLMIEPTESESKEELDRFCDAMISIHAELLAVEKGEMDRADNPLKNAPHPALRVTASEWPHPYSREQAAYPAPWLKAHKFWPAVGRVDNVFGDRNIFCSCPPVE